RRRHHRAARRAAADECHRHLHSQQDRTEIEVMPLAADQSTSANAATPVASKSGAAPGSSVLELRDVSIFYSDNPAVKSVSCYMERHKITAIIGPSGCGKSTLLRSLNRMNDF